MNELCYHSLDIAAIVAGFDLRRGEEDRLLGQIWLMEQAYLKEIYRKNQKQFLLDVRYWMHYLYDKTSFDTEFPAIQKDFLATNHGIDAGCFVSDYYNLDLFFKSIRIRILCRRQDYIRIKFRTLLKKYGYKRRSQKLVDYINKCLDFYKIEPSLRGGLVCDIEAIDIDDMITFRVDCDR